MLFKTVCLQKLSLESNPELNPGLWFLDQAISCRLGADLRPLLRTFRTSIRVFGFRCFGLKVIFRIEVEDLSTR